METLVLQWEGTSLVWQDTQGARLARNGRLPRGRTSSSRAARDS